MSRVGKNPIVIPSGVTVNVANGIISVTGKLGQLSMPVTESVVIEREGDTLRVKPYDNSKRSLMNWGTVQRRLANMVNDVVKGVTINMEMNGVGYRAALQGNTLTLQLGFSHDIVYKLPEGISAATPKPTNIDITGYDRQKVGQVAAEIRSYRPPEPYKGKGVKIIGEFVLRKEGKKK